MDVEYAKKHEHPPIPLPPLPDLLLHPDDGLAPLPERPSVIIGSSSGGNYSNAAVLYARWRWPNVPIVIWHAHLEEMDWEQTPAQLDPLAARVGARRVTVQVVYKLSGICTPTGHNGVEFLALHDVDANGSATVEQYPDAIRTLLDFAVQARSGRPPTRRIRWCTRYFKAAAFDFWVRCHRAELGPYPILVTGERTMKSTERAKRLVPWEWRSSVGLQPGNADFPQGWRLFWLCPVINWRWHHVNAFVHAAGVPFHPGYFAQGETLESMLDPHRDECQGRARLSCRCCIFSNPQHLVRALENDPDSVTPAIERVRAYEHQTGFTWQQRGSIDQLIGEATTIVRYHQQLLLSDE